MRLRSVVVFLAGTVFGVVLLARCGMSPAYGADGQCVASGATCPEPVVKSGTRLKAIVLKSDDGAQQFVGWWDSKLGAQCTLVGTGTDGSTPADGPLANYNGRCVIMAPGGPALPPDNYASVTVTHE